jgi:KDO2-lipid IV(A) lauroyltransferase
MVYKNLENAFPEKTPIVLKKIEKSFYKHFSDLVFESIKSLSMSRKEFTKRLKVKNIDLILERYENRRSAILYAGHFGNWERIPILPLFVSP